MTDGRIEKAVGIRRKTAASQKDRIEGGNIKNESYGRRPHNRYHVGIIWKTVASKPRRWNRVEDGRIKNEVLELYGR